MGLWCLHEEPFPWHHFLPSNSSSLQILYSIASSAFLWGSMRWRGCHISYCRYWLQEFTCFSLFSFFLGGEQRRVGWRIVSLPALAYVVIFSIHGSESWWSSCHGDVARRDHASELTLLPPAHPTAQSIVPGSLQFADVKWRVKGALLALNFFSC